MNDVSALRHGMETGLIWVNAGLKSAARKHSPRCVLCVCSISLCAQASPHGSQLQARCRLMSDEAHRAVITHDISCPALIISSSSTAFFCIPPAFRVVMN